MRHARTRSADGVVHKSNTTQRTLAARLVADRAAGKMTRISAEAVVGHLQTPIRHSGINNPTIQTPVDRALHEAPVPPRFTLPADTPPVSTTAQTTSTPKHRRWLVYVVLLIGIHIGVGVYTGRAVIHIVPQEQTVAVRFPFTEDRTATNNTTLYASKVRTWSAESDDAARRQVQFGAGDQWVGIVTGTPGVGYVVSRKDLGELVARQAKIGYPVEVFRVTGMRYVSGKQIAGQVTVRPVVHTDEIAKNCAGLALSEAIECVQKFPAIGAIHIQRFPWTLGFRLPVDSNKIKVVVE